MTLFSVIYRFSGYQSSVGNFNRTKRKKVRLFANFCEYFRILISRVLWLFEKSAFDIKNCLLSGICVNSLRTKFLIEIYDFGFRNKIYCNYDGKNVFW